MMYLVQKSGGVPHAVPEVEVAKLPEEWVVLGTVGTRSAEASSEAPEPAVPPRKAGRKKSV